MNMCVITLFDRGDHFADVLAILDDRIAWFEVLESDFMAEWNVLESFDFWLGLSMQRLAADLLAGFDVNDSDSDIVSIVMYEELNHSILFR